MHDNGTVKQADDRISTPDISQAVRGNSNVPARACGAASTAPTILLTGDVHPCAPADLRTATADMKARPIVRSTPILVVHAARGEGECGALLSRTLRRNSLRQEPRRTRSPTRGVILGRVLKWRRHMTATLLRQPHCCHIGHHCTTRLPRYEGSQSTAVVLLHYAAAGSKKTNLVGRPPVVLLWGCTRMTAGIESAVLTRVGGDTDRPVGCRSQQRETH